MRFIYHPDDLVYMDWSRYTYAEFKTLYPDFPITEGQYFSWINDEFSLINKLDGDTVIQKPGDFQHIIDAIGEL